jgi:lipoprotein NlpI
MPGRTGSMLLAFTLAIVAGGATSTLAAETVEDEGLEAMLEDAAAAARQGDVEKAVGLAQQAAEKYPDRAPAWSMLAELHAAQGRHDLAVTDYDKLVALQPTRGEFYNRRGAEQFKGARIEESIADFDKYIELVPSAEPGHWMRGISYYYARRYDDGRRQFEGYQTVDDNDVENAVWRYLCMARAEGVDEARAKILKIGRDTRVPMMQVYDLFRGTIQPDEVLAAAREGDPTEDMLNERLFYAYLYLGLYYEAAGDKEQALAHIARAADEHRIGHYMWHVARVHAERLRKPASKPD